MDYEEWAEEFQPLKNHFEKNGSEVFDTFGEQWEYVSEFIREHRVWTLVEDGDGSTYIVDGCLYVNRLAYLVTTKPYDPNEQYDILDTAALPCEHEWAIISEYTVCTLCGKDEEDEDDE